MRNLLLFILLLIGVWWFRRSLQDDRDERPAARPRQDERLAKPAERMQACAHCGMIVPESEGVSQAGEFFCSAEHARLGPTAGAR